MFITAFTKLPPTVLILRQIKPFHASPSTSWRSILILHSHIILGLPSCIFPPGFHTKTLYAPLLSPIRATCPTHLVILDFITRVILGDQYSSLSSSFSLTKNQASWNFVCPAPEVTWRTVSIMIRVVLLSPYLCIRGVSVSSIHYNQSRRVYINQRHQYIAQFEVSTGVYK